MKPLDVVATKNAFPGQGINEGQVGTIVEELDNEFVLVEFADLSGVAYAIAPIPLDGLIELKHAPALAA